METYRINCLRVGLSIFAAMAVIFQLVVMLS